MGYIIPNAPDTGSGQKYVNINQAEPDALDIEMLGLRDNWVRSGGTISVSGGGIQVAAGVVVVGGTPYSFSAYPSPSTYASISPASNARFDAVIARLSGGTVSVVIRSGEDSATNPTLPKSKSVLASGFDSSIHIDPDTDVLLGTIYVAASTILAGNIVDKRIVNSTPLTWVGSGVPTSSAIDVPGDKVVYNGKVYQCLDDGSWEEMATAATVVVAGPPVGAIFAWPGSAGPAASTTYLPCDGQALSKSGYPTLYSVLGSTYGEDAATFNLPNLNNASFIIGQNSALIGTTGGTNSYSLAEANLPTHNHGVAVTQHEAHYHSATAASAGSHFHATQQHTHTGALIYRPYDQHNGYHILADNTHTTNGFHVDALGVNEMDPTNPYSATQEDDLIEYGHELSFKASSNPNTYANGGHQHTITVGNNTAQTHTVTETSFGSASPTAIDNRPKYVSMRWYIRVQ